QGYRPTNEPQRRATSTARRSATNGRSPVQQQRRKPVRKVRRRHPFRTFFLMLLLAMVMCGGIFALIFYQQIQVDENTFYRGVYVDGVSLNGASPQEAHDYLEKRAKTQLGSWSIQLCYGHDLSWKVTPDLLEMQLDVADQINQAWQQGRIGNVLERYQTIIALRATPYYGYTTIRYNEYRLDELLREIKQTVDVQAQDAMQTYIPDRVPPFVYTDEVVGRTLNIENLKAQVLDMVNRLESGEVAIQPDIQQPAVTVAELQGEIVRLSSVRTPIHTTSTPERNRNIEIGCEKFDGKVVKPGAKVSFNDVVGKRTQNNGFQPALEIAYGEYREGIGGGICQCSSTLYNAVVEAGLEIVKRTAHAIPSSYVEKGKDATVSDGGLDLVFRNTTGA
ncbi:MAG: VanW family protein, partial [Clostridia bacterium]